MSDVTRILSQFDAGGLQAAGPKTVHNNGVMRFAASVLALTIPAIVCGTEPVVYEREVKPILQARCVACHGPLKQEAGLRLDTAALAIKGGESGAAIKPGEPSASRLVERISATTKRSECRPKGSRSSQSKLHCWGDGLPRERRHQRMKRSWTPTSIGPSSRRNGQRLPLNADSASRNPIDAFIDAEHKRLGLTSAAGGRKTCPATAALSGFGRRASLARRAARVSRRRAARRL